MSVQAVMIPRDKDFVGHAAGEPLLELLERLLAADVNQMPVVSTTEESPAAAADPNLRKVALEIRLRSIRTPLSMLAKLPHTNNVRTSSA